MWGNDELLCLFSQDAAIQRHGDYYYHYYLCVVVMEAALWLYGGDVRNRHYPFHFITGTHTSRKRVVVVVLTGKKRRNQQHFSFFFA